MRKKFLIANLALVCIFFVSCSSNRMQIEYSQNQNKAPEFAIYSQSNVEKENERTPDLSGGAESAIRTSAHNPTISDRVFRHGNPSRKQAALTFDDGPDIYFTTRILNILKEHGIHATFFIMGKRAEAHPEIVRRIVNEGHAIGNHTWDHPNLTKLEPGKIKDEINKTEQKLDKIVGYHPSIFRPPYGSASPSVIKEISSMGYYTIDWSVDTRDWAGTPPSQIMKSLKSELGPGGIILQHCAGGKGENLTNTLNALPQMISYMKQNGYKFVTIPELLNVPAAKK